MDKTLQILINNANDIIQDNITITKDQSTIKNSGFILSKNNMSIPCRDKTQLIKDILAEIYNQGEISMRNKFKQLLGYKP